MSSIFEDVKAGDIFICKNGVELVFIKTDDEMVRLLEYTKDKDYIRLYNFDGTHISGEDGYTIVEKKSDKRRSRDWWWAEEKENIIKEFKKTGF